MVPKGNYKIIQILDISHSLLTQKEEEQTDGNSDIRKVLLESKNNEIKEIAYLVDLKELGQGTEIFILKDLKFPILYKKDLQILNKKRYVHNLKFIEKIANSKLK